MSTWFYAGRGSGGVCACEVCRTGDMQRCCSIGNVRQDTAVLMNLADIRWRYDGWSLAWFKMIPLGGAVIPTIQISWSMIQFNDNDDKLEKDRSSEEANADTN